jgi:hypothetical protein
MDLVPKPSDPPQPDLSDEETAAFYATIVDRSAIQGHETRLVRHY